MDPARHWNRIEELFYAALDLDAEARNQFLDQACGGDAELRREVESLLKSSSQSETGNARKAVAEVASLQSFELDLTGKTVGAYRLIQMLGEGGMGAVYLASRADESYHQQVAIKLMHAGYVLSQRLFLRFTTERQILANLNHSGIARLLDGGMTEEGVPYLVMEYVDGIPIDDFCRTHVLSLAERLRLFCVVCDPVEYAHKNLVIHRDIKPANILVTAGGVPKLLDFGIAKLLDADATSRELTGAGERFMTPEYASPEQLLGNPITTATDVYALGGLLYELLTGKRPFQSQTKSPLEAGQMICEQDPAPPSQVVEKDKDAAAPYAARELVGDLDNIVLTAMRKKPSLRYSSVASLSADVQAYLTGHAVQARTPTWAYRSGKFVRRHKMGVALAILALLSLMGFSTGMGVLARRASQERHIADQQKLAAQKESEFLASIFDAATPQAAKGSEITARELLDQGAKRIDGELAATPDVQATMLLNVGVAYSSLGLYPQAQALLERAYSLRLRLFGEGNIEVARSEDALATVYRLEGQYAKADSFFRRALLAVQTKPQVDARLASEIYSNLGECLFLESKDSEAESLLRKSLTVNPNPDGISGAATRDYLARVLDRKGELAEAWKMQSESVELTERAEGPDGPDLAIARHNLAAVLRDMGNILEAEKEERQTLALWRKVNGDHADVAYALNNLGWYLTAEGDWQQAQPLLWEAVAIRQKLLGDKHPLLALTLLNCGRVLQVKGDYAGAEKYLRKALEMLRQTSGAQDWNFERGLNFFSSLERDRGNYAASQDYAQQALELSRKLGGSQHPEVARSLTQVALGNEFQGHAADAVPQLEQVLAIRQKLLWPAHPDVIAAQVRLGEALIQDGKAAAAEPILRQALASVESEPFPLLPWQVAEAQNALGACLAVLGHSAEAGPLLRESRAALASDPEAALRQRDLKEVAAITGATRK